MYAVTDPADILERYEYVYPHSIDVYSMKKDMSSLDIVRSARNTMLYYGVSTNGDAKNVYSMRAGSKVAAPLVAAGEEVEEMDLAFAEEAAKKPDVLPPRKDKAKKEKKFPEVPNEPKRIDFELLNENDYKVYAAMKPDMPMVPEEISPEGMSAPEVIASLTMLEICGAVEAGSGGYYIRSSDFELTPPGDTD